MIVGASFGSCIIFWDKYAWDKYATFFMHKKRLSSQTANLFVNLKSNTMKKITDKSICFFCIVQAFCCPAGAFLAYLTSFYGCLSAFILLSGCGMPLGGWGK